MNSRNPTKVVEHKLILFATVRTLWTLGTLLIKLFRILLNWKYVQDQNYPFWPLSGESKAILSKMFRPGHRARVFIWENFHPGYRDLGLPLIWAHRYFYREKSGEARSRKPSQPGWPGSYEEALNHTGLEFLVYFRISYDTLWAAFLFRIFESIFNLF